MKPSIHPNYQFIVVRDISTSKEFLTRSSIDSRRLKGTASFNGAEYPLLVVDISSDSHPFFTGEQKLMDTEGRVDRYYRKFGFQNPAS